MRGGLPLVLEIVKAERHEQMVEYERLRAVVGVHITNPTADATDLSLYSENARRWVAQDLDETERAYDRGATDEDVRSSAARQFASSQACVASLAAAIAAIELAISIPAAKRARTEAEFREAREREARRRAAVAGLLIVGKTDDTGA